MTKTFKRTEPTLRDIKKMRPFIHKEGDYNFQDVDTIWEKMGKKQMKCSVCGKVMEPYRDYGHTAVWRCHTPGCYNNPDYLDDKEVRSVDTPLLVNRDRYLGFWKPRRLI